MDIIKERILSSLVVGFEYEFYSNKKRDEIAREIAQLTRKKVKVGDRYHSNIPIGIDTMKLEPDYSGGSNMNELITGPMPYHEAIAVMYKMFTWIKQHGWTDEKCALQVNISFDKMKTDLKTQLSAINRMKYVLGFNEQFIYEKFPKRKNNIYARSINSIFPLNKFVFNDSVTSVMKENYELPSEKYYGVNFGKLADGYLEIRYMGGRGYEKMPVAAKEVVDYVGTFTHDVLQNNNTYTEQEVARLRTAMKEFKKTINSFSDYDAFCVNYPGMRLLVDLKGERQTMRTFYPMLKEMVFDLIVRCGVRRGVINYDASAGKHQIKGAVISRAFSLKNMEVFDCKINGGNVLGCDIYRCEINNSHIMDSQLLHGNKVSRSRIIDSPFNAFNEAIDTYIDNKKHIINGKVEGGIIRSGEIGPLAKISETTEVIKAVTDGKDKGKDGMLPDKPRK